ncbi:MAG: hypothetical protein GX275_07570 [Clostridiales bacterium]|nr:hypothetical protein [Clostridiales bacterium]
MERDKRIDVVKGLCIIGVILLHILTEQQKIKYLIPFHIYQAVPLFLIIAGYNNCGSYIRNKIEDNFLAFYSIKNLYKKLSGILIPFIICIIIEKLICKYLSIGSDSIFRARQLLYTTIYTSDINKSNNI